MSSEAAALIEAEYAERLKAARNDADLDALWWSMVAEATKKMSDAVYSRFVMLDDDARTRLRARSGQARAPPEVDRRDAAMSGRAPVPAKGQKRPVANTALTTDLAAPPPEVEKPATISVWLYRR